MKANNPLYLDAMQHQIEAINFATNMKACLLAHDMGLGKTFSALRICCARGAINVLVVCPAIARRNWAKEVQMWTRGVFRNCTVVEKGSDALPTKGIVICSYNLATRGAVATALKARQWDVLIIDEAHYLKNKKAARTKAIYGQFMRGGGLVAKTNIQILLTGTPVPNHVGELWTHLSRLFPEVISGPSKIPMSHFQFMQRYCEMFHNSFGWQVKGNNSKTIGALKRRLKPIIHRRRKTALDLPPLRITNYYMPPGKAAAKLRAFERSAEGQILMSVLQDASQNQRGDTVITALATLRRLTSIVKAEAAAEMAVDEFENGLDKLVLFAHHRSCIEVMHEYLCRHGLDAAIVYGGMTENARQAAIDHFQDGTGQVLIGQLQAASTAINLHASSNVWLVESDWVPGNNAQAINRCHRIGQNTAVLARFITLAGSIDEVVQEAIARKTEGIMELGL